MTMASMLLPGMPGHLDPSRVRLAAAAHITPEVKKANTEKAVRELNEREDKATLEALKTGTSIFVKQSAVDRRRAFMTVTEFDDIPLLVRPNYWDEVKQGLARLPISPWWLNLVPSTPEEAELGLEPRAGVRRVARDWLQSEFRRALKQSLRELKREDPALGEEIERVIFDAEGEA